MSDLQRLIARLEQDEARLRGLNEICSGLGGKCQCDGCQHRLQRADNLREAIVALTAEQPPAPAERERIARLDALAYETALAVVRSDIEFRYEGPLESQVAIIRAALDAAAQGGEQQ